MSAQGTLKYVELSEARAARGVRMVALWALPSPWTEAAKGIFHVKEIPVLAVRHKRGDAEQAAWAGVQNAPVVFFDAEAPRTGWAEILLLAERLGGCVSLIPSDPAQRARLFGLAHEICGEDGLAWSARLVMVVAVPSSIQAESVTSLRALSSRTKITVGAPAPIAAPCAARTAPPRIDRPSRCASIPRRSRSCGRACGRRRT